MEIDWRIATVAHDELKDQVIWACGELSRLRLTAGTAGNVSIRVPGTDQLAVSPSSVPYATLRPEDVCVIELESGDQVEGDRNPTTELLMHRAVHRGRADVGAVVHAHCKMVTALGLLGRSIPPIMDEQVAILGGEVALAEHRLPGSRELAEAVVENLGDRRAVMLRFHGMLAAGRTVEEAVTVTDMTERLAEIVLAVLPHGEPPAVPDEALRLERMTYEMSLRAASRRAGI